MRGSGDTTPETTQGQGPLGVRQHLFRCFTAWTVPPSQFCLSCRTRTAGSQLASHHCHPSAPQAAETPDRGEGPRAGFVPHREAAPKSPLRFPYLQSLHGLPHTIKPLMDGHQGCKLDECLSGDLLSKHLDVAGRCRSTRPTSASASAAPHGIASPSPLRAWPSPSPVTTDTKLDAGLPGLPGTRHQVTGGVKVLSPNSHSNPWELLRAAQTLHAAAPVLLLEEEGGLGLLPEPLSRLGFSRGLRHALVNGQW